MDLLTLLMSGSAGGGGYTPPALTDADDGKVLGAVNKKWDKVRLPQDTMIVTAKIDMDNYSSDIKGIEQTYLENVSKTTSEILAAAANKNVILLIELKNFATSDVLTCRLDHVSQGYPIFHTTIVDEQKTYTCDRFNLWINLYEYEGTTTGAVTIEGIVDSPWVLRGTGPLSQGDMIGFGTQNYTLIPGFYDIEFSGPFTSTVTCNKRYDNVIGAIDYGKKIKAVHITDDDNGDTRVIDLTKAVDKRKTQGTDQENYVEFYSILKNNEAQTMYIRIRLYADNTCKCETHTL